MGPTLARGLAQAGAAVALSYLTSRAGADETVITIAAGGGIAAAFQADVSLQNDVVAMVRDAAERLGPIDILVNNAAVYPRKSFSQITEAEWDRVIAVNLKGAFLCAQAVAPAMQDRRYGRIINLSSVTAWLGNGPYAHYIASKAGLIGLTRALATELGAYAITVNALAPGAILTQTEIDEFPDQENLARWLDERQAIPGRLMPDDLIGALVFLASDASARVTGQTIIVDGGWVKH